MGHQARETAGHRRGFRAGRDAGDGHGGHSRGAERRRSHGGSREAPLGRGMSGRGRGGGGGRGGRGGGRMFGPGDLRLVLLALVAERPGHGYELIKQLEEKFGGAYSPSPGSIYPTLALLEDMGYLQSTQSDGSKRLYEITAEGRSYVAANDAALRGALSRMELAARAVAGEMPPQDLHQAMHTLKTALALHRGAWDEAETARVRQILEDAAQMISTRPPRS